MQNTNYVLIGMSILTISCIYLFYLNFCKTNSNEHLVTQARDQKYTLDVLSEDVMKIKKLITYNSSHLETLKKIVSQLISKEVPVKQNNLHGGMGEIERDESQYSGEEYADDGDIDADDGDIDDIDADDGDIEDINIEDNKLQTKLLNFRSS